MERDVAEGDARHASFLGPQPNRGGTVTLGLTCCAVLMQCIIILHFVPVFKPVFYYLVFGSKMA